MPDFRDIVYGLLVWGALVEARLRGEDDKEGKEGGKGFCSDLEVAY